MLGQESRSEPAFMSLSKIDDFIKNSLKRPQRCHFHQFPLQVSHVEYMEKVHTVTKIEVRASFHKPQQNRRFYRK